MRVGQAPVMDSEMRHPKDIRVQIKKKKQVGMIQKDFPARKLIFHQGRKRWQKKNSPHSACTLFFFFLPDFKGSSEEMIRMDKNE